MLHFLDTNVLLYSISRDPSESFKRERAVSLLDEDAGALSVQVRRSSMCRRPGAVVPTRFPMSSPPD